jgi:hypothetical protein
MLSIFHRLKLFLVVIPNRQKKSVWYESENIFPVLPQGKTPPGIASTVASLSSVSSAVATPASYHLKNDPRELKEVKQVCHRS